MLPEKRIGNQPLPLVVWIHGGGWRNGDKRSGINRVAPVVATGRYVGATIGIDSAEKLNGPYKYMTVKRQYAGYVHTPKNTVLIPNA